MLLIVALIILGVLLLGTGLVVKGLFWLLIIGAICLVGGLAWGAGKRISGRRGGGTLP